MTQFTANDMRRIAATLLIVLVLAGPAPAQFSPPVQERSTELTDVLRKQALALHERSSSDLRWTFTQTNAPFDLTGVDQVIFNYAPRTGGFTQVITGSVLNATAGIILIPFTPANTSTNGTFEWNIEVSQAGNPILKSPFGDLNLIRRPGGGSTNVFPTTGTPIDLAGIDFLNFPWIEAAETLEAVLSQGNISTNYIVVNGMTNTSDLVITNGNLVLGESEFIPTVSFIHRKDNDGQLLIDGGREGEGGEILLTGPDLVGTENEVIIRANGGITIRPKTVSPPAFYLIMTGNVARIGVDLIPDTNGVRNLGSPEDRFATLFLETNSIDMKTVILSADNGALLINGTAVITNNSGPYNAAGATNLNADNIAAGTLADARLSANVSLLGQSIAIGTETDLDGTSITNLNATAVTLGTLADGRLSANVSLLGQEIVIASETDLDGTTLTNLNASNVAIGTLSDSRLSANASLLGQEIEIGSETDLDGTALTNLNATAVTLGTLNDARLSATVSLLGQTIELTSESDLNATALTNLNASQVTLGTLADLRLSANVDLLDGMRAWTDNHNAGGNSLTNLDTTVTFGMDDGSVVFVNGTDIFYVSADGTTTNDLTATGVSIQDVFVHVDLGGVNQLIPDAGNTVLAFSNEVEDTAGIWNPETHQATIVVAGLYELKMQELWTGGLLDGGTYTIEITTNNSQVVCQERATASGASALTVSGSIKIRLPVGATVQFAANSGGTSDSVVGLVFNTFGEIELLRED